MLRIPLAAALAALLLLAQAAAFGQGLQYKVEIDAPRELRDLLSQGLQLLRWQSDPQMSETLLERLVAESEEEVREAVATRGYFSARVSAEIDRSSTPWTVIVHVEPGEPVRVARADVEFSGPAATDPDAPPLLQRIRREWRLKPGERFTQNAWNDAKTGATRALAAWRYAAARIAHSRALVNPDTREAALDVDIESGPPFRYGTVEVRGTERYPQRMVAQLSPATPGALYDRETLLLYERRLLATGYFVSAQASILPDPEVADAAPVRAAVIEGRSQQAETGLSFNTDVGFRLEARYRNMDLFHTAWRLRSEVQLDSKIRQGRLDLDTPPGPGGIWRNHFVQARETKIQNETTNELSGGVSHNWGLGGETSSLIVSGHVEEQRILGTLVDHRHAIYFGYRTQFRDTDSWQAPRRGYLAEVSLGGSPSALASQQFLRGTVRAMLFIPVGADDLLLRGEAGGVAAAGREGIPATFLFRTGGDQTVRGYAFESLGVPRDNAIIGGRYLAIGSVEYTRWIAESWGVAGFVDGGNAWDSGGFHPVFGYGVGARFRTPVGPVRADIAYGEHTRQFRLHFSVGLTF